MIEGLHVDLKSEELKKLLIEKAELHEDRVSKYEAGITTVGKAIDDIVEAANLSSSYNPPADPIGQLKQKIAHHRKCASLFRFLADHVALNETFRLSTADLTKLEIGDLKRGIAYELEDLNW